jgi:hypothetical protein
MLQVPDDDLASQQVFLVGHGGMIFPVQLSSLGLGHLAFDNVAVGMRPARGLIAQFGHLSQLILG